MKKVFISTSYFGKFSNQPLEMLKSAGLDVSFNPYGRVLSKNEILEFANEVDGLIAGTEQLDSDVLRNFKKLKVISRCGVGIDNIDLEVAETMKIKIYNTPDVLTKAVAELTIGLMLDCLRYISRSDRDIRNGKWNKPIGELLGTKTVGIIGYGRIGKAVAKFVQAFGAKILVYDIALVLGSKTEGVQIASFDDLISKSDIITLHIPKDESKSYIIDKKVIECMKKEAYLINTSRGGLIDEDALYEALKSGKIAGAAIDTFEREPYKEKLIELDNIVLTSHIGSYAKEARIEMEKQTVENLLIGLRESEVI